MKPTSHGRYGIRPATPDDIDELVRMQLALQESMIHLGTCMLRLGREVMPELREYYPTQIADEQTRLLVAEDGHTNETVGMGTGKIWVHAGYIPMRSGELIDLWIEPDHRRRGLARRVVRRLLRFFAANEIEFLAVNYTEGNPSAEALWKELGFKPVLITATAARCDAARALVPGKARIISVAQDGGDRQSGLVMATADAAL